MSAMARKKGETNVLLPPVDQVLILTAVILLMFGMVMVASASLHMGERYGNTFHFLNRHLFAILLGTGIALFLNQVSMKSWEKISTYLFIAGLLFLALLLIPGVGREANGAVRWIPLAGFNIQPAEFMKLVVVLYLAGYLVRRQVEVAHSTWAFIKPLLLLVLSCSLLLMQPDFGTTAVILITAFGMLFIGGAPLWQFAVLLGLAVSVMFALVWTSPYRMERITSFLNPWADPLDSGYQLAQALIAFGRGEWIGVGLGNGIQKQFYLPEAHTDFLMAVIGEEFGLLGTLFVIAVFSIMVWRAFSIGATAESRGERYSAYVAYGLGLWLGLQAFINIGVNIGLLPTKGLTLPFMSYGSNSIIVWIIVISLLTRIYRENKSKDGGEISWQSA